MSTDYRARAEIAFADVFDGRLERFGVREQVTDRTTPAFRCLTDGQNYVWVFRGHALEALFTCYVQLVNDPRTILDAAAEAFQTEIFSEHEPQYWGFETGEEREAGFDLLNALSESNAGRATNEETQRLVDEGVPF